MNRATRMVLEPIKVATFVLRVRVSSKGEKEPIGIAVGEYA